MAWKPRSSHYQAIAQARASLSEPSRPFTPAETGRHLFRSSGGGILGGGGGADLVSRPTSSLSERPTSSFSIGRSQFIGAPAAIPVRPTSISGGAEVLYLDP